MWLSYGNTSADEPPTPEQILQWQRRISAPENEIPAGVGLAVMLGRADDAAVGITQVEAFSTGFRFTLAVRLRRARPGLVPGGLFMLVGSHHHPGREVALEERLLLGVEYSDGRRASTVEDMRTLGPGAVSDDEQLVLVQHGGGGGELSVDQAFWVSPLPPEGPVTFVMAWPAFGMPESRTVVDGAIIRAAAGRSQLLWPPQPPMDPPALPPPPRPSSGWFAEPPG